MQHTEEKPMSDQTPATATTSRLTATDLQYSYGKSAALRGISLTIEPHEIVTISGPSGCGKSTLLLNLAGVLTPDSGTVTYGERPVSKASETERSRMRRSIFGILFQFGQLVNELSAEDNIALPLLLAGRSRPAARQAASEWLERLRLTELRDQKPTNMSGGQMQRVAICRAMVTRPEVLFADEPTGALDALASEQVMSEVVRVARDQGTTLVIVTHDPKVAAYGTREIRMIDGALDAHHTQSSR